VWLLATGAGSVVETFVSAAWTLAYREITGLGLTGQVPDGDSQLETENNEHGRLS
jgi:hypothetical protein